MTRQLKDIPLFDLAFRPFFLSGALFSVIAVLVWTSLLNGWIGFYPYGSTIWWHSHEMLFGFATAIIVGFLLTAVQNWTGQSSVKGKSLALLWLLWFVARLMLAIDLGLGRWVVALVDLAFLPLVAFLLANLIIRVKLWRNLVFVFVILLMTIANGLMHWAVLSDNPGLATQGSYAMVMLVTLLMTVLGGRVFPMFTANGTGTQKVESIKWLEIGTIGSTVLIAIVYMTGIILPTELQTLLLMFAAVCHLIRLLRWRFWVTLKTPLVWSLHLSYACIPAGLFLMALHYSTNQIPLSTALHGLTIGAMGSMILAMITRVSLGHTGRNIVVGKLMSTAFIAIFLSFLVRVFLPVLSNDYSLSVAVAAILWALAYGIFSTTFFPILTTKRRIAG